MKPKPLDLIDVIPLVYGPKPVKALYLADVDKRFAWVSMDGHDMPINIEKWQMAYKGSLAELLYL